MIRLNSFFAIATLLALSGPAIAADVSDVKIETGSNDDIYCRYQGRAMFARNTITNASRKATIRAKTSVPTNGYPRESVHNIAAGGSERIGCERPRDSALPITYTVIGVE